MNDLPRDFFEESTVVFSAGDPGDSAYVIESGCVEILVDFRNGQRRVALLGEGALFGEVALLDCKPRTATVRTLLPTTLLRIDRKHIEELLRRSDPVVKYLLNLLLKRFRSVQGFIPGDPENASPMDFEQAALRTLTLTRDLSHAVDVNQLELFYQPLFDCTSRTLLGYEALIRWQHPTLGLVMPSEFISLAERTGIIHRIGNWVIERATRDWAELRSYCRRDDGLHPFVSINLSAAELGNPDVVSVIERCLKESGMPPGELKIELTETVIIEDRVVVAAVLEKLAGMGMMIALDDFGTGYAGLEYLRNLPISCLKIDKAFVQEMLTSLNCYEIVRAAISLAGSLGFSTIAEGIEDEATLLHLTELGCNIAQGFLLARPMPLASIGPWVEQYAAAA